MGVNFKELVGEHNDHGMPCPACRAEGALRGAAQWVREYDSYDHAVLDPLEVFEAELMAVGVLGS